MTTLDFARKYVRFDKSSPITGPFNEAYYPFLIKPFAASDDIHCKRLVLFKSSSCLGTVAGQIINIKRVVCDVGDQKMVCQTDDDAETWSKTRGKEWLYSIPDAKRLLSKGSYAVTNSLWLFRHKFLEISGPGENAAQSLQVRYVQTDESHLDAFEPGMLTQFEKRMGARWDRQGTHITTAPDEGKEVDGFFHEGDQNEWHYRCPKCNELFWPLFAEYAQEKYGQDVFVRYTQNDIRCVCPHCDEVFKDESRSRYELVKHGDYVAQNPDAPRSTQSFRWTIAAAHWVSWQETMDEYDTAIDEARKLGGFRKLEDWTKKRACISWKAHLPIAGDGVGNNDYSMGDSWGVNVETVRIMAGDVQAGKADEGAHLWVGVDEWDIHGNSRRLDYRRLETFGHADLMHKEFEVKDENTYFDSGHDNRRVFRECGKRHWYATRGSDAVEIMHRKTIGGEAKLIPMPYSQTEPQSGIVGAKINKRLAKVRRGALPDGWCYCIVMCNPTLYGYLYTLVTNGPGARYYGIAKDFPRKYSDNMPAFIPVIENDKKTNQVKRVVWKQVRETHPWDVSIQSLLGAMRAGFFPLAGIEL